MAKEVGVARRYKEHKRTKSERTKPKNLKRKKRVGQGRP